MAINKSAKGWMSIPGIRDKADRTIEEQLKGLDKALAEAKGKTVLDLGSAEGAIGLEFAKAGAIRVVGIEVIDTHIEVAREYCKDYPQMEFICAHLAEWAAAHPKPEQFDIVLALGVIHKLRVLKPGLVWAARSCRDLFCFRSGARTEFMVEDYTVEAKRGGDKINVPATMRAEGFVNEGRVEGSRQEIVDYWRRKK